MVEEANICPLCNSSSISEFSHANNKLYYRCDICCLIFLDKFFFLSPEDEKQRYSLHNNNITDEKYITHIKTLTDSLLPYLKPGDNGLDYGSGGANPVAHILGKIGYLVKNYDPFFYRDERLLKKKYDFVTCIETVEHFYDPAKEFEQLSLMLNKPGILGIMTNIYSGEIDFDEWWYIRDETHVCFYSKETFELIAKVNNWNIIYPSTNVVLFKSLSSS